MHFLHTDEASRPSLPYGTGGLSVIGRTSLTQRKAHSSIVLLPNNQTHLILANARLIATEQIAVRTMCRSARGDIRHSRAMETYADRHAQTADLSMAGKLVVATLRTFNDPMKERKLMKTLLCLCAAALLAACSSMPSSSQQGEVRHPDAFHSYID